MKMKLSAAVLALGALAFVGTGRASAEHHPHQFPQYAGYGNGRHDLAPHGHTVQTPFGNYSYFGNGLHDLRPHDHTVSPFGGLQGYSNGPFRSTQSYNGFPGYSGFNGNWGNGYGSPFRYGGGYPR